ncbi:MAG: chemotaxis protein CheW [Burkholderia sp.]|nr:chemotaxis protein CheW [Burkholderia sp.]
MHAAELAEFNAFLPYMPDVGQCARSLVELNTTWRMIEASTRLQCSAETALILPTMEAARSGFIALEQELVSSLVAEKLATAMAVLSTKAQYVIDIIVRNLYERTADVGFLATDSALCGFVAGVGGEPGAIRQRLQDYRSKYTVYDDIVLLDADGRVLLRLDTEAAHAPAPAAIGDPLLAEALASDHYVEIFRHSELQPHKRQALIYGRRMLHPQTGAVAGVLCLCFDFEREMTGIFGTHRDADARYNMLLLDENQHVIASADAGWIAPGERVPVNYEASHRLQMYCGRLHLVRTIAARAYQGYAGPRGWSGQVMLPIDVAFHGQDRRSSAALAPELVRNLLGHSRSFCPPLHAITAATDTVRRTVWNGQVMGSVAGRSGGQLDAVIELIGDAGARSNALFTEAGNDLSATAIGSGLDRAAYTAELMADLLERNLYERANDCRWWALAPLLRGALAQHEPDDAALRPVTDMLTYINGLYTVYSRIVVYGVDGRILAESVRDDGDSVAVGMVMEGSTLEQVLGLRTAQDYFVTPFTPTALYGGRPAWVYHAAVRDPSDSATIVGGIGLVFDAAAELGAMLADGLGQGGGQAYFIDREGRVLAGTAASRPAGAMLAIDPALLAMARGDSSARLAVHDGEVAMLGCCAAQGYREFKTSDGYRDDVLAVVLRCHGPLRRTEEIVALAAAGAVSTAGVRKYATFSVGGQLHAIEAAEVREAYPASAVAPVSAGAMPEHCGMLALREGRDIGSYIWVADLARMLGMAPGGGAAGQVIVVRHSGHAVGILVDTLDTVAAFADEDVVPAPLAWGGDDVLVRQVIRAGGQLVPVVDAERLRRMLDTGQVGLSSPTL